MKGGVWSSCVRLYRGDMHGLQCKSVGYMEMGGLCWWENRILEPLDLMKTGHERRVIEVDVKHA